MNSEAIAAAFSGLETPQIIDAVLRVDRPVRLAPAGLLPIRPATPVAGRVLPARHAGSVDVFLEAFENAGPGDILVVDNQGRTDEACIGDLTALEARAAGVAAMLVWGLHRDQRELLEIGLPVFSYGRSPSGPRRLDPRDPEALASARFGEFTVSARDAVFADDDGAVFVPLAGLEEVLHSAREIRDKERLQADAVREGRTLRDQLHFREYLARRKEEAGYSFRQHLRKIGGEIEE